MKKWITLLLIAAAVLSLVACTSEKIINLKALENEINSTGLFTDGLAQLSDNKINSYIRLDVSLIASESDGSLKCVYYTGSGVTGEEYGIFECNSADDAKQLITQLEKRQASQQILYATHAPVAAARIGRGFIRSTGVYVFYIVADQYDKAATIADRYF